MDLLKVENINREKVNLEYIKKEMNPMDNEMVNKYLNTLDEKEMIAILIAYEHLESSFDIEKCIHYQKFLSKQ